jgi:hypothetical protein
MASFLRHLFSRRNDAAPAADSLQAYLRAFADRLESPASIAVADLQALHAGFASSLHRRAASEDPDVAAFLYAALRLPDGIENVQRLLLGPGEPEFAAAGFPRVADWPRVQSRARRRRWHHDGGPVLAVFVTSRTDLDDLVPSLCALQIEWNKMHGLLARSPIGPALADRTLRASAAGDALRQALRIGPGDWDLLRQVWDADWDRKFFAMAARPLALRIDRLPLHSRHFEQAADQWWDAVSRTFGLDSAPDRPLYLVSSNVHALPNLLSGFAAATAPALVEFIHNGADDALRQAWRDSLRDPDQNRSDLLYYALRQYLERHPDALAAKIAHEQSAGIRRFLPTQYPHLEAQKIELSRLSPARLDSRLRLPPALARSPAWILNLDYPLGLAANHVMAAACARFPNLRGVFILGKSAAALGRLGDVLVPSHVYDAHAATQYRFRNHLCVRRLAPFLNRIAAYDDQKSITVRGTFLHGRETMAHLLHDDYAGMEMEAGPYLAALYQHFSGHPPPPDATLDLPLPETFALGILHYTSDTPYNVRPSLLSSRLGLAGLEATYACSLCILQAILHLAAKDEGRME